MGRLVLSLFNPSSCLLGRLEPGVLRPYRHVLQRGGRRAPTHHTMTSCLHFITNVSIVVRHYIPTEERKSSRRARVQEDLNMIHYPGAAACLFTRQRAEESSDFIEAHCGVPCRENLMKFS